VLLTFLNGVTNKWNAIVVGKAEHDNGSAQDPTPDGIVIRYEETEAP
jgi:hypothetical protein